MKNKYDPIINDNSEVFIGSGFEFYLEAIREDIDRLNKFTYNNQCIGGCIAALISLSESFPKISYLCIDPRDIEVWKDKFVDWAESKNSKLPKANVEDFKKASIKEFDKLNKLVSKGVKV